MGKLKFSIICTSLHPEHGVQPGPKSGEEVPSFTRSLQSGKCLHFTQSLQSEAKQYLP